MTITKRRVTKRLLKPGKLRPRREEVHAKLIEGAMEAFAERGFAGASIDFICAKAGFSRGAFYSNFDNKEALFFVLYEKRIDRLYERLSELTSIARTAPDPLSRISDLLSKPDADEIRWDILNKEFIVHALRNKAARDKLILCREGTRTRMSDILLRLSPELEHQPDRLLLLCRFVIALHEGELTQIGLEPELQSHPSLLSIFAPALLAAKPHA